MNAEEQLKRLEDTNQHILQQLDISIKQRARAEREVQMYRELVLDIIKTLVGEIKNV